MSLKNHFSNMFAGCRLLAETRDEHRDRDVRVYMVPGEVEVVGVTDGVDCWAAPVIINPFSCDVQDLLRRIHAGENVPVVRKGSKPSIQPQDAPTQRRRLSAPSIEQNAPQRRRLKA